MKGTQAQKPCERWAHRWNWSMCVVCGTTKDQVPLTELEALKLALPYVESVAKRVDRSPRTIKATKDAEAIRAAIAYKEGGGR